MNAALRRLGYGHDEMTSHGVRTIASTGKPVELARYVAYCASLGRGRQPVPAIKAMSL